MTRTRESENLPILAESTADITENISRLDITSGTGVDTITRAVYDEILRLAQVNLKRERAMASSAKTVGFDVPLVVRLEGTNVEAAREILEEAKQDIPTMQFATDLADAAQKVCAAVG